VATREHLPATARGHHAHGNRTILVGFDLDPRDVDLERAYTISALSPSTLVASSVCSTPFCSMPTTAPSTMA
jgi:hypothetical protein